MSSKQNATEEAAIRALVARHAAAVHDKDIGALLDTLAPDVVIADLAPPLRYNGPAAATGKATTAWFATWQGPIDYEIRDLVVTAGDEVAFCTGFVHIGGTKTDGEKPSLWARQTLGLKKFSGEWKIVHDHHSVPFHMDGSLRAAVDLEPN